MPRTPLLTSGLPQLTHLAQAGRHQRRNLAHSVQPVRHCVRAPCFDGGGLALLHAVASSWAESKGAAWRQACTRVARRLKTNKQSFRRGASWEVSAAVPFRSARRACAAARRTLRCHALPARARRSRVVIGVRRRRTERRTAHSDSVPRGGSNGPMRKRRVGACHRGRGCRPLVVVAGAAGHAWAAV